MAKPRPSMLSDDRRSPGSNRPVARLSLRCLGIWLRDIPPPFGLRPTRWRDCRFSGCGRPSLAASARESSPLCGRRPSSQLPRHPWLDVDNMTGAKSMTEHLISLGHRRIATITGPLNSIAGHDRLDGYRLALAQAGIAGDDASLGRRFYRRERLLCDEASHAHGANNQTNVHFRLGHLG
jgi:hypothetical protein